MIGYPMQHPDEIEISSKMHFKPYLICHEQEYEEAVVEQMESMVDDT